MNETLIFFGSGAVIIVAGLLFRYLGRRLVFDAVQKAIEKSDTLDAEVIAAITQGRSGPGADLRKGILFLAVALATALFGLLLDHGRALAPALGLAAFPGLVGVAFLLFHRFPPARRGG